MNGNTTAPDDRSIGALRRQLLAEAAEVAHRAPANDRERLLSQVAVAIGKHVEFDRGLAAAEELTIPLWRTRALAGLAGYASDESDAERARARLRLAAEALATGSDPAAGVGEVHLRDIVKRLVEAGDFELANRLCIRFPDDDSALDSPLRALLRAGMRKEALELALRLPEGVARDGALETVAEALAESGEREAALTAVERIGGRFTREEVRLDVLYQLSGAEPADEGSVVMREVRGALSALHAMWAHARSLWWADDEEGARAFATAAARIAAAAVDEEYRERALERAAQMQGDFGDVDGALSTARALPEGERRDAAVQRAFWRLVPEDEERPVRIRAIRGRARGGNEGEIAAVVIALALLERRDVTGARRWLRRVRTPARRSAVLTTLGSVLLEHFGDAVGAERALRHILPERRDDTTARELAIAQLRRGDGEGAAATLEEATDGREWATMSLSGLAARYGQADRVRDWARMHLGATLRVNALLGAVLYLEVPPPYEGPGAYVFPETGAGVFRAAR